MKFLSMLTGITLLVIAGASYSYDLKFVSTHCEPVKVFAYYTSGAGEKYTNVTIPANGEVTILTNSKFNSCDVEIVSASTSGKSLHQLVDAQNIAEGSGYTPAQVISIIKNIAEPKIRKYSPRRYYLNKEQKFVLYKEEKDMVIEFSVINEKYLITYGDNAFTAS